MIKREQFIITHVGHILNYYRIIGHLGMGSCGVIFKGEDLKTNIFRAIKEVRKSKFSSDSVQAQLAQEIEILKYLDHPNIMKIYEVIESTYAFYIVCEYLTGDNLMEMILQNEYQFEEHEIAKHMDDILYALCYCHKEKVTHNHMHPDNLMFESKERNAKLKVIDFGIASKFDNTKEDPMTSYGQLHYRPPESYIIPKLPCTIYNAMSADIWSAGIIFYILLTGRSPVIGKTEKSVKRQVKNGLDESLFQDLNVSDLALDLLKKLLNTDPHARITAAEALRHEWFGQVRKHNCEVICEALDCMKTFRVLFT